MSPEEMFQLAQAKGIAGSPTAAPTPTEGDAEREGLAETLEEEARGIEKLGLSSMAARIRSAVALLRAPAEEPLTKERALSLMSAYAAAIRASDVLRAPSVAEYEETHGALEVAHYALQRALIRSPAESEQSWVEQHATEFAETAYRLRTAVEQAAGWFREYERMHIAKGATEKAERNAQRARVLEAALKAAPASGAEQREPVLYVTPEVMRLLEKHGRVAGTIGVTMHVRPTERHTVPLWGAPPAEQRDRVDAEVAKVREELRPITDPLQRGRPTGEDYGIRVTSGAPPAEGRKPKHIAWKERDPDGFIDTPAAREPEDWLAPADRDPELLGAPAGKWSAAEIEAARDAFQWRILNIEAAVNVDVAHGVSTTETEIDRRLLTPLRSLLARLEAAPKEEPK